MKVYTLLGKINKRIIKGIDDSIASYEEIHKPITYDIPDDEGLAYGPGKPGTYIDDAPKISYNTDINYSEEPRVRYSLKVDFDDAYRTDLEKLLANSESTFSEALIKAIDEQGIPDPVIYQRAGISRQLFNKIKNDVDYHPNKNTVYCLIAALHPTKDIREKLLKKAGYAFSNCNKFDIILEFCFDRDIYNISEINSILDYYEEPKLSNE